MSASVPPPGSGAAPDPSMEDILASIRRILSEDEQPGTPPAGDAANEPEVVALDESMLVAEPPAAMALPPQVTAPQLPAPELLARESPPEMPGPIGGGPMGVGPMGVGPAEGPAIDVFVVPAAGPAAPDRLIAPEAEAAATSSVSSLLRTLEAGRSQGAMAVYRGGPTLEDIVREEMRPLLKAWLDSNLPPLVERLVRAEIERLVGRALS